MKFYYKKPRYFDEFYCIGGDCPETCCAKWNIDWYNSEVDKLKTACGTCSPELKQKIECSFMEHEAQNIKTIILDKNRKCPFLTENGLCDIQKELGEDHLSTTCRVYPRQTVQNENIITRVCGCTCYKVIDLLCEKENSIEIVVSEVEEKYVTAKIYDRELLKKYSTINFLNNIFNFFCDILNKKDHSIETSIILGALAAKKLSDFEGENSKTPLNDVIALLRPQMNNAAQIGSIEAMNQNYLFSFGVINDILKTIYNRDILDAMCTDGKPDVNKYLKGKERYDKFFADNSFALRNIMINIFYELFSFGYDYKKSIFENYMYFVFSAAAVKLAGYTACYASNNVRKDFRHYISLFARELDSNLKNKSVVIDYLREHNWFTPAYAALMIK